MRPKQQPSKVILMLLSCILIWAAPALGENLPLELLQTQDRIFLNPYLTHLADASKGLSLEEARAQEFTPLGANPAAKVYTFGFSDKAHWLKVRFKTGKTSGPYFLQQGKWYLHQFDVWLFEAGNRQPQSFKTGSLVPIDERPYAHQTLVQPLVLQVETEYELVVRAESKQVFDLQLILWKPQAFDRHNNRNNIFDGIYYGGLLLMFLYNLSLAWNVKDKAYFFYSLYLGSTLLNIASIQGHALLYLWPDQLEWNIWAFPFMRLASFVFVILFVTSFLKTKEQEPTLHRFFLGFILIAFTLIPSATVLPIYAFQWVISLLAVAAQLTLLVAVIRIYRAGNKEAIYIGNALVAYAIVAILVIPRLTGWVHNLHFGIGAIKLVQIFDIIMFSMALAARIRNLRNGQQEASAALITETRRHAEELEGQVQSRTLALESALHEAKISHDQLLATQAQMVQSEKMAGLGTLVAGVAHEINNPSSAVLIYTHNLKENLIKFRNSLLDLAGADSAQETLDYFSEQFGHLERKVAHIEDASLRVKTIVEDLRNFSRLGEAERSQTDLVEALRAVKRLISAQYSEQVIFVEDFQVKPLLVCWPAQLNQVFINLMVNACQAITETGKTGTLTLSSRIEDQHLALGFEDTGCGMSASVQEKIFDPFFTTKSVGEGTGMGMSISFSIVQKHQGRLEVQSKPGEGTLITLRLPMPT